MAKYNPPEVASIMGLIESYMKWKQTVAGERGFSMYHPSALGKCLRQMQYYRYAQEGIGGLKLPNIINLGTKQRIFDTGHTTGARWVQYFEEMGILRGVWECRNPLCGLFDDQGVLKDGLTPKACPEPRKHGLNVLLGSFKPIVCNCGHDEFEYHEVLIEDKELNIHGHCDIILDFSRVFDESYNFPENKFNPKEFLKTLKLDNLPKMPVVIDMKTCHDRKFGEVLNGGPSLDYTIQLTVYANILNCEFGLLIYENKNDSQIASFKIEKNSDTVWQQIRKQLQLMNQYATEVNSEGKKRNILPPPRHSSTNCTECRYCPFLEMCSNSSIWKDKDLNKKIEQFYGNLVEEH